MFPTPATSYVAERERLLGEAEEQPLDGHLYKLLGSEKRYIRYEGRPLEVRMAITMLRRGLDIIDQREEE